MQRRYQRKMARLPQDAETPDRVERDRPFKMLPDGGYQVLHPTKGWMRFSARRLMAINRLRWMHELIAKRRGLIA